jgi:hypothetical protein
VSVRKTTPTKPTTLRNVRRCDTGFDTARIRKPL